MMRTTINLLLDLQKVDLERKSLESRASTIPRRMKEADALLEAAAVQAQALPSQAKTLHMEVDKKDLDFKELEEKVKRLRVQLNAATSNKEYSAILHEIGSFEANKSVLEDTVLELMTRLDAIEANAREKKKHLEEERTRYDRIRRELEEERSRLEREIRKTQGPREEIRRQIDSEAVSIYERLIKNLDGEVVVPVTEEEKVCAGCHMEVQVQIINLLMRNDQIVRCRSCGRILYLA